MKKIIVRIKGGLGNQLFCYAAARKLAINSKAELVIDDVTGFKRDYLYKREYALENFNLSARKASPRERFEPCEILQRNFCRLLTMLKLPSKLLYLEQSSNKFDNRIINLVTSKSIYLDGYWQSEEYFQGIENIIRQDLVIKPPIDKLNLALAEKIKNSCSVAVHFRWFNDVNSQSNISLQYYKDAILLMESKIKSPHYYIFSDNISLVYENFDLPKNRTTIISNNSNDNAYADMWLMGLCKHFITANSTFSWWGAWLGNHESKIVITPEAKKSGIGSWGFPGLIPCTWIQI